MYNNDFITLNAIYSIYDPKNGYHVRVSEKQSINQLFFMFHIEAKKSIEFINYATNNFR